MDTITVVRTPGVKQIGFSMVRFILLCLTTGEFLRSLAILSAYLSLIGSSCSESAACSWFQHREITLPLSLILIAGCINDLLICIVWDVFTHGSIFATVTVQLLVSVVLLAALPFSVANIRHTPTVASGTSSYHKHVAPLFSILAFLSTLYLVYLVANAWFHGPKGSWKRGVKDLQHSPNIQHRCSVFGRKRSDDDSTRIFAREAARLSRHYFAWFRGWLGRTVFRHIQGIESESFALTRNIIAIILLFILVIYCIWLSLGVINESLGVREIWAPFLGNYKNSHLWLVHASVIGTGSAWTQYSISSNKDTSLPVPQDKLLQNQSPCFDLASFGLIDGRNKAGLCDASSTMPLKGEVIYDIALVSNNSRTAKLGRMWWILPTGYTPTEAVEYFGAVFQYNPGVQLLPGYHLFGVIQITEKRLIRKSFFEMMGFSPTYTVFPLLSLKWMNSIPLHNSSIARATFSIDMPTTQTMLGDTPHGRVIQGVRTKTFLGTLPSIAALLALFQSLQVFCFGRPLFWGLFGSRLLDPFGLFGAYALRQRRDRLRRHYGDAGGLAMFLDDFGVLNVGPLADDRADRDLEQAEEGQRPLLIRVAVNEGVELAVRHQGNPRPQGYGAV